MLCHAVFILNLGGDYNHGFVVFVGSFIRLIEVVCMLYLYGSCSSVVI